MKRFLPILLAAFSLMAQEEEHTIPASRPLTEEARGALLQRMQEEENAFGPEEEVSHAIWVQETYYSDSYHWFTELSILGDLITLEDGSIWSVKPSDRVKLSQWRMARWRDSYNGSDLDVSGSDFLLIIPNQKWFSSHGYQIVNRRLDQSIQVDMSFGPFYQGKFTKYITGIDLSRGQILLNDGSLWEISSSDDQIFKDWSLNDTIIVGSNEGWFSRWTTGCENILIDVEPYTHVRAKQIQ